MSHTGLLSQQALGEISRQPEKPKGAERWIYTLCILREADFARAYDCIGHHTGSLAARKLYGYRSSSKSSAD